jgi:aromatic ring-opening dioxygenase catalytic subunit (LigB family)
MFCRLDPQIRIGIRHDKHDSARHLFRSRQSVKPLVNYEHLGPDAALSIPTPDHYLPLLDVIAARRQGERIKFPVQGVDGGEISMLAVQVG